MYDDEEDDDFSDDYTESDEWTTDDDDDDEYEDPLPRSNGAGMKGRAGFARAPAREARPAPPPGPPSDNPLLLRFIKQHQLCHLSHVLCLAQGACSWACMPHLFLRLTLGAHLAAGLMYVVVKWQRKEKKEGKERRMRASASP
eukprot:scaffold196268_cov21-Tisochrysis_lutea.AAC.8